MGDELKQWCEEHEFDFDQLNSLNLTIEKLVGASSSIVLAERLGLTTSAERGRLIDGIKALRAKMSEADANNKSNKNDKEETEVGLYDDPEVIVKDNKSDDFDDEPVDMIDYSEFENTDEKEAKEQKSIHEETFMLRSNFSDDPEDQWDIVKFFDNNAKFNKFKPILLLQMQIQNSANYNCNEQGNQNDQLDHLLDSMLGSPNQNDSSSDSDDDIYNTSLDTTTFRQYISSGYMPSPSSLIYDIVLAEYSFTDDSIRQETKEEKAPFYASINYAQTVDYESDKTDNIKEHFITIALKNNVSAGHGEQYKRYKLNLVIALETSSSMGDMYGSGGSKTKQRLAAEMICNILDELGAEDKFCLISFSDTFNIEVGLDDIASMDRKSVKKEVMLIDSSGGGVDFDEGYNAGLGQLQELFDAQIMAAAAADSKEEDDALEQTENRIILIGTNLPNYDSSLMDLMQVYSDSDENKIYSSFLNIGDMMASNKLINNVNKLRGCNIRNYCNLHVDEVLSRIKIDFKQIINPIYFNVNLTLKSLKTDTIYGYYNNMKKITKLNGSGCVRNIKTVYDENENGAESETITIRLQPPEDDAGSIAFEIELSYEYRNGKSGEFVRGITLDRKGDLGIVDGDDDTYFDNKSMRKRVILIKYIELLNEWVARDSNTDNTNLNVSDQFKTQFIIFLKYFEHQIQQINDDQLNQEIDVLNQLIQFDEKKGISLRKSANN